MYICAIGLSDVGEDIPSENGFTLYRACDILCKIKQQPTFGKRDILNDT